MFLLKKMNELSEPFSIEQRSEQILYLTGTFTCAAVPALVKDAWGENATPGGAPRRTWPRPG